jgi:hypothetical protein
MVMRMALIHTAEQAAEIIGGDCKASWLREKARLREIPHTMISGSYHFTGAHLDEIVQAFERLPQPAHAKRAPARAAGAQVVPVTMLTARTPRRRANAA